MATSTLPFAAFKQNSRHELEPIIVDVNSAGDLKEIIRIATNGRPLSLRIEVLADAENADSITDMAIASAVLQGDHLTPRRAGADFMAADAVLRESILLDDSGEAITDFPSSVIPEGGVVLLEIHSPAAEWVLSLKGVATVRVTGRVG